MLRRLPDGTSLVRPNLACRLWYRFTGDLMGLARLKPLTVVPRHWSLARTSRANPLWRWLTIALPTILLLGAFYQPSLSFDGPFRIEQHRPAFARQCCRSTECHASSRRFNRRYAVKRTSHLRCGRMQRLQHPGGRDSRRPGFPSFSVGMAVSLDQVSSRARRPGVAEHRISAFDGLVWRRVKITSRHRARYVLWQYSGPAVMLSQIADRAQLRASPHFRRNGQNTPSRLQTRFCSNWPPLKKILYEDKYVMPVPATRS